MLMSVHDSSAAADSRTLGALFALRELWLSTRVAIFHLQRVLWWEVLLGSHHDTDEYLLHEQPKALT